MPVTEVLLLIFAASATSAIGGVLLLRHVARASQPGTVPSNDTSEGIVFLFEGRKLLDATSRATALLPRGMAEHDDWSRFLSAFGPRFSNLAERLEQLTPGRPLAIHESTREATGVNLHAELNGGIVRVALIDPRDDDSGQPSERYAVEAMETELATLRSVAEKSPVLTWNQREDGTVTWANGVYLQTVADLFGPDAVATWPPRSLFGAPMQCMPSATGDDLRVSHAGQGDGPRRWYQLVSHPSADGTLQFAVPIDGLVQAEESLKEFIGTLGKTFAQLPIGLAIFDMHRRLVLFNPALVDLTGLDALTLTQRPSLHSFLDALRDNQRIPEPRDYKSWRLRIAQLEAAATDGRYQETWTLPTGQTFRVTGQPHPDGAVAFLFEDISSEISLKRRFRSEIDLGLAVMNALDQAVAVFAPDGTLSLSNAAYGDLWGIEPETALSRISLDDSIRLWFADDTHSPAVPDRLRRFVTARDDRVPFSFDISAPDGTAVKVRVRPLPHRITLVEFCAEQSGRLASGALDKLQTAGSA